MGVEAGRRLLSKGWPAFMLFTVAVGLMAGCTAATGSTQTASPPAATETATPGATDAPAPSATSENLVFSDIGPNGTWLLDEPLDQLAPDASIYASLLTDDIGIAVVVPGQGTVYELNGDEQFTLASVAKVPIMLTLLDQTISEGRQLTDEEQYELTQMITESDNDAADWLWSDVGGAEPVSEFLQTAGIDDAVIDPDDWGSSTLSPVDSATLMAELVDGDILDAPSRALAMNLLESVDPSQAWGSVVAASDGAETGVKNGWYPNDDGWVLNSTGYVLDDSSAPDYTIAIFSEGESDYSTGISDIEQVAQQIYTALSGTATDAPAIPASVTD